MFNACMILLLTLLSLHCIVFFRISFFCFNGAACSSLLSFLHSLSLSRTRLETLASLSLTSFWKKKWICVCNYGSFWSCFVDWNRVYEIMRLNCVCASDLVWFCFECVNLECFFLLSLEDSSVWGRRIVFDSWRVFVFLCIRVYLNMKHGHRTLTLVIIWKKWIYWM